MADMLALTLIAYVALKALLTISRSKGQKTGGGRNTDAPRSADSGGGAFRNGDPAVRSYSSGRNRAEAPRTVKEQAASAWEYLRNTPPSGGSEADVNHGAAGPPDFDARDFLDGARMLYSRLQTSWAARDLDDIAPFVSPDMLHAIQEQARDDPRPRRAEVVHVQATLTGVTHSVGEERAVVFFEGLLREEDVEHPIDAREMWHFTRALAPGGMWRLDAIETVRA
jgi:predicted lipid-binding transport protein (Tim44 family)